ncbi:MAG TPA: effector binding domain-containing protein [Anditalea sp.]|nr:effector binding domain-containing protein [Anditalea sp.]
MEKLQLKTISVDTFRVIGITLPTKTQNINDKSSKDCGSLWEKFLNENYSSIIPGKINEDIIAVYFDYEGDHWEPFSYIIGHRVEENTSPPPGLQYVDVSAGEYLQITAQGNIQECTRDAWNDIWQSDLKRSYLYDFEIYEAGSDNDNAEVDIYIGIK